MTEDVLATVIGSAVIDGAVCDGASSGEGLGVSTSGLGRLSTSGVSV